MLDCMWTPEIFSTAYTFDLQILVPPLNVSDSWTAIVVARGMTTSRSGSKLRLVQSRIVPAGIMLRIRLSQDVLDLSIDLSFPNGRKRCGPAVT